METLGKTLKGLREEKGMTLMDVSKATKIRTSILSALENEEWDKLPQKIFIKGFVKAYIQAVGGDEGYIMDLFEASCPVVDEKIACPTFESEPMDSLTREKGSYKWILVLILLVLIAGGGYFLFQKFSGRFLGASSSTVKEETTVVVPPKETKIKPAATAPQTPVAPVKEESSSTQPSVATTMGPSAEKSSEATKLQPEKETVGATNAEKPVAAAVDAEANKTAPAPKPPEAKPEETASDNLVITARMETWIGLKIDGKTRKEILLKPGKTFSAKVDKFVELLIGNAGGIDITYNGEKVENIGKPGQVVRLRLPREESEKAKKETPAP